MGTTIRPMHDKFHCSLCATHWRKKPVVIQAHRWFKNGDHPEDNSGRMRPEVEYCEGAVVRYFRHPTIDGKTLCSKCGNAMYGHGWIDTLEDGHNVCPGDWIITGVKGEHYPCKPDIFDLTYEPASTVSETAPIPDEMKWKCPSCDTYMMMIFSKDEAAPSAIAPTGWVPGDEQALAADRALTRALTIAECIDLCESHDRPIAVKKMRALSDGGTDKL